MQLTPVLCTINDPREQPGFIHEQKARNNFKCDPTVNFPERFNKLIKQADFYYF